MSKIYEALRLAHRQKKTNGENLEVVVSQNLVKYEEGKMS
jgi:hypothetical protein